MDNYELLKDNDLKNLIKSLLSSNAKSRPSPSSLLKHPFLKKNCTEDQLNIKNQIAGNKQSLKQPYFDLQNGTVNTANMSHMDASYAQPKLNV